MSNPVQDFIDVLVGELTQRLPPEYSVQAREPLEGELDASASARQVFVTVDGIENADPEYADGGHNTRVRVPVMVGTVMRRPVVQGPQGEVRLAETLKLARGTLARRLSVIQAIQKARRSFAHSHSTVLTEYIGENPQSIEGFYVSVAGVLLEFNLDSEGEL